MEQTRITKLWNKFKALPWWKKLLLLVPFILMLLVYFAIVFWSDTSIDTSSVVEYNKKKVDKQIKAIRKEDKQLIKDIKKIETERVKLKEEEKDNEEEAENLIKRIDSATDKPDELIGIITELNARQRRRDS